ncbi:Os04g0397901 [Oryza sativa Japonica Group]|uniref:Os04g0397901 protein n=2 Tax=Oryza sativa subsp. japonica TaxID=39947 RepID=C7J1A4_ORYSJ|nr:Os04g0397901 [Oryza sativa Japonica Group]|eukprot:NP_001173916.1 Os04g0397901 [Oryza sativa Japonica Group]
MWCFPISCESFEPSGSQLLNHPRRIRLHHQALLLFRQADLPSLLSSYIVQVVIHYFDKQSAEFINSAAGAITVSYIMQLLTGGYA